MILRFSIRNRLSLAFVLLGLLLGAVGLLSLRWLGDVNAASVEIRDRWLQSSRLLGDLNNATSDFRTAEADFLLSEDGGQRRVHQEEMVRLRAEVEHAAREFGDLPHAAEEAAIWARFDSAWTRYLAESSRDLELARQRRAAEALRLYHGASQAAFGAASDALGLLTSYSVLRAREASDRAEGTFRRARVLILLAMAMAVIMVVLVMNHIAKTISAPLLELAQRMHELAENRTNIEVASTERVDEVGEMARAVVVFRNNAIELAHSKRGLEQQASMLAEKLEHEQHLTTTQRNFVAMASHEFRTPLTVIDGQAQRLIKVGDRLAPEEILERAGRVRAAVRRMTNVLETLISSARLLDADTGLYFHPLPFNPAALLHDVCQMHREASSDAWVIERLAPLPATMVGDPRLLFQALSNLVSNAVKYSPVGKPVWVRAVVDGERLVVLVEDEGMGIAAEDLPRLFQRYFRGANARGMVGTGIGLYLVKTVVALHGGDVEVHSDPGKGSRFTLRLPLQPPALPG